jgi:hypothetical protein
MKQVRIILLIVILHTLVLSACDSSVKNFAEEPGLKQNIDIYPTFSLLQERVGHLCGSAIYPVFTVNNKLYQYTRACLYVYNPDPTTGINHVYLAKLGKDLVEAFPAEPDLGEGFIYLNGHTVWPELTSLYNDYGQAIIGLPRTGLILNSEKNRYEQFFEKMAFYRNFNEPVGTVHTIPLGAWMCAGKCELAQDIIDGDYVLTPAIPQMGLVDPSLQSAEDFFRAVQERKGQDFTGRQLSSAYRQTDGAIAKIYENLVMILEADEHTISFLPLPQLVGIVPDAPVSMNGLDYFRFYPVTDDGLGYNVHQVFVDYITLHGADAFGQPITELHAIEGGASRQCFQFICLENHPNAPEGLKVRPMPLGLLYQSSISKDQVQPEEESPNEAVPASEPEDPFSTKRIYINVWERYPLMAPGMKQEIGASLIEGDLPIAGADFILYVDLPDGTRKPYFFPSTNREGQTTVTLDPIIAPIKTNISYQVCLQDATSHYICVSESFLIWLEE